MDSRMGTIPTCQDCGAEHLGRCGGLSFRERLASVRISPTVSDRTLRNYYDRESIDAMFGNTESERREQYMDETKGRGKLDKRTATTEDLEFYMDGPEVEDVV